jgi:predicted DNA binding CopG/RHH family protein
MTADVKDIHQINIKVDKKDLDFIDAKASKYGLTRSALIKFFALNGDFTVEMAQQLRRPRS